MNFTEDFSELARELDDDMMTILRLIWRLSAGLFVLGVLAILWLFGWR